MLQLSRSKRSSKELNKSYAEYLDEWLKHKRLGVKESTFIRYKSTVEKHIKPILGEYSVAKIDTSVLQDFAEQKLINGRLDGKGGLSNKSVSDILLIVKEALMYAADNGEKSVCSFKRILPRENAREMRVLSPLEEKRLLDVLLGDTDRYKLGVFICLYTGIRIGELCALKWKNISLEDKILKIDCTVQRLPYSEMTDKRKTRIVISKPKSHNANRVIPLPDFVAELCKPFASDAEDYILSASDNITEPRTMQNKFKRYLKQGNISDSNYHALRHTFATRCVESGFDIKTLSEILGHSNVKITLDRYVHTSMELKRNNMNKLRPASYG